MTIDPGCETKDDKTPGLAPGEAERAPHGCCQKDDAEPGETSASSD